MTSLEEYLVLKAHKRGVSALSKEEINVLSGFPTLPDLWFRLTKESAPPKELLSTQTRRKSQSLDPFNQLSVFSAIKYGDNEKIKIFTEEISDLTDSQGRNILHVVCEYENYPALVFFSGKFPLLPLLRQFDAQGRTPLHIAASLNLEISSFLLEVSELLEIPDAHRRTPLFYAVCAQQISIVQLFLLRGVRVDHRDALGRSALHYAAEVGNLLVYQKLSNHGANDTLPDRTGHTPLQLAKAAGLFPSSTVLPPHPVLVPERPAPPIVPVPQQEPAIAAGEATARQEAPMAEVPAVQITKNVNTKMYKCPVIHIEPVVNQTKTANNERRLVEIMSQQMMSKAGEMSIFAVGPVRPGKYSLSVKIGNQVDQMVSGGISRFPVFDGKVKIPIHVKKVEISLYEISDSFMTPVDSFEISDHFKSRVVRGVRGDISLACITQEISDHKISGCLFGRLAVCVTRAIRSPGISAFIRVSVAEGEAEILTLAQAQGIFPIRFFECSLKPSLTLEIWKDDRKISDHVLVEIGNVGDFFKSEFRKDGLEIDVMAVFNKF